MSYDRQGKTPKQVEDSTVFCFIALLGIFGCIVILAILKLTGAIK